jgi:hypothetical protein
MMGIFDFLSNKSSEGEAEAKQPYTSSALPEWEQDEDEEEELLAAGWRLCHVLGKGHYWVPPKGKVQR